MMKLYHLMKGDFPFEWREGIRMVYEWSATHEDETNEVVQAFADAGISGSDFSPIREVLSDLGLLGNAGTVEPISLIETCEEAIAASPVPVEILCIDVESPNSRQVDLKLRYLELAKMAAPGIKVCMWNVGPSPYTWNQDETGLGGSGSNMYTDLKFQQWQDLNTHSPHRAVGRKAHVAVLGFYIARGETFEQWHWRNHLRYLEARRLYGGKRLIPTINIHDFHKDNQFRYLDADVVAQVIDYFAVRSKDLLLWGHPVAPIDVLPTDLHEVLEQRTGDGGRYRIPDDIAGQMV